MGKDPEPTLRPGREVAGVALVLLAAVASLVVFVLLDSRPPNDHDPYFSNSSIEHIADYRRAPDRGARRAELVESFLQGGPHPRLAQTLLVATLGELGPSRVAYRLLNLPFLVLLVLGTWWLGRMIGGPRVGLVAAWLVISMPVMVNLGRKFAPPWHAAALTPMCWALLLATLRLRGAKAWAAALGAGLLQGLRCYTHPIVFPEVALSTGLVGLFAVTLLIRGRTRADLGALLRVGFAGGVALALASHILGWTATWLGEPGYSLRNYSSAKGHIVSASLLMDPEPLLRSLGLHVREWWGMHLLPLGFLLVVVGAIALVIRLRRRGEPGRAEVLLLVLAFAGQAPLAILAVSRGTFTGDWMTLIPGAAVAVSWGMAGLSGRRGRPFRVWAATVGLHGLLVLVVPLALGLLGPGQHVDPDWYRGGLPAAFARSPTGRLWNTHHIPIRSGTAAGPLARLMRERGAPGPRLVDLTWHPEEPVGPCLVTGEGRGRWLWGPPLLSGSFSREWSRWPYLFEGFDDFLAPKRPDNATFRQEPAPDDPIARWIVSSTEVWRRRPVVVRLWVDLPPETRAAWMGCGPSRAGPALVEDARRVLVEVLGPHEVAAELWDMGDELNGMENEEDRGPNYLSRALVLFPSGGR